MELDVTSVPKSKEKDARQVRGRCRQKLHQQVEISMGKELTIRP
jgi:hypothetical protein